jgi:hypothetical protein
MKRFALLLSFGCAPDDRPACGEIACTPVSTPLRADIRARLRDQARQPPLNGLTERDLRWRQHVDRRDDLPPPPIILPECRFPEVVPVELPDDCGAPAPPPPGPPPAECRPMEGDEDTLFGTTQDPCRLDVIDPIEMGWPGIARNLQHLYAGSDHEPFQQAHDHAPPDLALAAGGRPGYRLTEGPLGGRRTWERQPEGRGPERIEAEYDLLGRPTRVATLQDGTRSESTFTVEGDCLFRVTWTLSVMCDPFSEEACFTRVLSAGRIWDRASQVTRVFLEFDEDPDENMITLPVTMHGGYHANGRPESGSWRSAGLERRYMSEQCDEHGRLLREAIGTSWGDLGSFDAMVTEQGFDRCGRMTSKSRTQETRDQDFVVFPLTEWALDAAGRAVQATRDGVHWTLYSDERGPLFADGELCAWEENGQEEVCRTVRICPPDACEAACSPE